MYHQITLDEWQQWKEDIREKLKETAGNFVYIGCRLKQIRDSGIFDGAADIFEFAQKEYGLSKSTVSRFIAINEKFADPYQPLLLREEYASIGSSKLAEMLTIPDSECEMISEHSTVKDIRSLKEFNREEKKLASPESLTEPSENDNQESDIESQESDVESRENDTKQPAIENQAEPKDPLEKCIYDLFKDEALKEALNIICTEDPEDEILQKKAYEIINPSGARTHKKGICFISMLEYERGIKYKLMGQEPKSISWEDFYTMVADMAGSMINGIAEDIWDALYGKEKTINPSTESEIAPEHERKTENEDPTNAINPLAESGSDVKTEQKAENGDSTKEIQAIATSQQVSEKDKEDEEENDDEDENENNSLIPKQLIKSTELMLEALKANDLRKTRIYFEDIKERMKHL